MIEEVAEVECPACHGMVPGDSGKCPLCGKDLAPAPGEKSAETGTGAKPPEASVEAPAPDGKNLKAEFSDLVEEVRPMLALAKDYAIDASTARRLIDKAVSLGKRREVDQAVQAMRECKELLQRSINDRLERDIMYLENLADVATKMNSDFSGVQKIIAEVKAKKDEGDLEGALAEARNGRMLAEQLTGKYVESHEMYEALEKLILNSERFYLDVREARKLLNEAREAGEGGDWNTMGILARKGREELLKVLPNVLTAELRKAKQSLLDAKSQGKDVTSMVKILKDAGVAVKREQYQEALERLTEFKAEEHSV